ncbi:MAG: hypothetical protein LQ340_003611 [Diploschistes diacapsis]|nr:MAG: hypothetical protein LQ340_003611 [Diploschistes diacapsis]
MLLYKPDRVAVLEKELERLDMDEPKPLFLGSWRRDTNTARKGILASLDVALKGYVTSPFNLEDNLISRTNKALARDEASLQNISNLQNLIDNSACLARNETEYLQHQTELMVIAPTRSNNIPVHLERPIEDTIIWDVQRHRKGKPKTADLWCVGATEDQKYATILLTLVA